MTRLYKVIAVIECRKMSNYGKRYDMGFTPMPHKDACTCMSKLTKYSWRRVMLEEVV